MISKNKLFISFSISFLVAIFLNNIFDSLLLSFFCIIFILIIFLNSYIYTKKYLIIIVLIIAGALIGLGLSNIGLGNIKTKQAILSEYYNNKTHKIEAVIIDISKVKPHQNEFKFKLRKIDDKIIEENVYFLGVIPSNFDLEKGYVLETEVKLLEIENFNGFEYKKYMLSKNIYFRSFIYSFETIEKLKLAKIRQILDNTRQSLLTIIKEIYPTDEGLFLAGILLGAREELSDELKTNFNNSGLTHFIAVSGFNITIIIIFTSFLIKYLPRPLKIVIMTIFVILFTMLVGETAPVVRATIMGLVGYYILMSGRKGENLSIILITAGLMLVFSPLALNYDISFQLSFLAVLGIIYTQNFFSKIFSFLPSAFAIKEAFVLTLSATCFCLPIMIFDFGQLSILSPLANILVTWTIPLAMMLGFLSILTYFIHPIFGLVVGYLAWIFLKYDMMIVSLFGQADFAIFQFDFGVYRNYFKILYFMILIFLVIYFKKKPQSQPPSSQD